MKIPQGGVAFFDSGIGGLTVMAACRAALPNGTFYYFGDNRHAPYGNLSVKKIRRYVFRAFRLFEKWKVAAAVVACNTATAVCVEELRRRFAFPIIGTEPAVYAAAKEGGEIFALSTRATYESPRYQSLLQRAERRYPNAKITAYPCDDLAGAIERNLGKGEINLCAHLPRGTPNAVVLGCTHYSYVRGQVEAFYHCKAVDGNEGIARRLKSILEWENAPSKVPHPPKNHSRPPSARFYPQSGGGEGRSTDQAAKGLSRRKPNKRLFLTKKKTAEGQESKGGGEIYFFGGAKKRNEIVYKQMFV